MLDQLKTKLEARLAQREQAIANVNALNGAIEELRELIAAAEERQKTDWKETTDT